MRKIENNDYCVYIHTFPDGKKYIGLTNQNPATRWGGNGNGYRNQEKIFNAIQKFGWNNIKHEIYKDNLSSQEAQNLEKELIEKYNTIENGYNTSIGGGLGGYESVKIEYNGKVWLPSELEAIAMDGITAHDITTRLGRNWSVEKAISQPTEDRIYKREYNGKLYTIKELSQLDECVVDSSTIKCRLSRGWSVKRAITQYKNVKVQPYTKEIKYNGEIINVLDVIEIAKNKYNIDLTEADVRDRINRGWDIERVVSRRKIRGCNKLHEYNGEQLTTVELSKIAKEKYGLELSRSLIASRIRKGMSVEEAISSPLKTHKHKNN
jgi:hypothetical protein